MFCSKCYWMFSLVVQVAYVIYDQWALADKRMHINNNWWRQKRRLVKSASCNYVTANSGKQQCWDDFYK